MATKPLCAWIWDDVIVTFWSFWHNLNMQVVQGRGKRTTLMETLVKWVLNAVENDFWTNIFGKVTQSKSVDNLVRPSFTMLRKCSPQHFLFHHYFYLNWLKNVLIC